MKMSHFVRYTCHVAACTTLMAGCSAAGPQTSLPGSALPAGTERHNLPPQVQRLIAMTRADHGVAVQRDVSLRSWMKHVPSSTPLLYVSDNGYYPAVVDVFNYNSGSMVGQVAGSFEYLYDPCSDKKGNVYVPDFKSGVVYEIQHRTTNVIKSWADNGNPIGCSVSGSGNIAVSAFHYGGVSADGAVIVYPGGAKSGTVYGGPGDDFPATYDKAGDIFVEADYAGQCTSPCLAELPKGGKSWKVLSYDQSIYFPGSVELMGKSLGVGDQQSGGSLVTGIYATTLSGDTAHNTHTTTLTDSSCSIGNDVVGWANVSKKPNGLQLKTVTAVSGANVWCETLDTWKFPAGGDPNGIIRGAVAPHGATLIE